MRAGITFSVDVDLKVGALAETITVTGDSPMIETGRPTSVLNIDGDLVRSAPITSRRLFSDALDLAPGVGSRNVDDGVGRRAYYFRGSHIYAHAFQLEGAPASAYIDSAAHSMGMGGDTVQDVEIKLGGADASTPLSTGVVMNVVTPRGQNQLKGSLSYSYQPLSWNGDNTKGGAAPGRVADLPGGESVGRVAGRQDHQGPGLVLRHLSLCGLEERHQPHRPGPGLPARVQSRLRAVRQFLGQQAAVREGDDAGRQARAVGLLAVRPQQVQQQSRARHAPDQPARRRRVDVSRQAELGVGRPACRRRSPRPTTTRAATPKTPTRTSRASAHPSTCTRASPCPAACRPAAASW